MRAPLVPITIAFMVGITLGRACPYPWIFAIGLALSAGVCALGGRVSDVRRLQSAVCSLLSVMLLWCCLGFLRIGVWSRHPEHQLRHVIPAEPQMVRIHGIVTGDPASFARPFGVEEEVGVLRLLHVNAGQGWRSLPGRLQMIVQDPRTLVRYGDELVVEGMWSQVPAPTHPGSYDPRPALARQRIYGVFRVKPYHGLAVLHRHQVSRWLEQITALRQRWERLIRLQFADREAGVLLSALLGQRVTLDEQLKAAFIETGTMHLLVVSGSNVALIAWLLEWLFRLLGIPWRLRLFVVGAALWGYALLTGWQPPVVRAMLMGWMVLGALALDRVIAWMNLLAAAALVVLWGSPTQLWDPSFQLSFGAVLTLLLFVPRWSPWCTRRVSWVRPLWCRRFLIVTLTATAAVWVGLAPLLAWYFHLVVPIALVANLIIAPLMSALVGVGTTILLMSLLCGQVMDWTHGLLQLLLTVTIHGVTALHMIPGGCVRVPPPAIALIVGYYGVLAALLFVRFRTLDESKTRCHDVTS